MKNKKFILTAIFALLLNTLLIPSQASIPGGGGGSFQFGSQYSCNAESADEVIATVEDYMDEWISLGNKYADSQSCSLNNNYYVVEEIKHILFVLKLMEKGAGRNLVFQKAGIKPTSLIILYARAHQRIIKAELKALVAKLKKQGLSSKEIKESPEFIALVEKFNRVRDQGIKADASIKCVREMVIKQFFKNLAYKARVAEKLIENIESCYFTSGDDGRMNGGR